MEKAPFNIQIETSSEKTTITFSGQLIINHINKIFDEVKESLNMSTDIDIVISQPENIDVTFIQLICSIKNSYNNANKKVQLTANVKDELKTLVANSGFNLVLN